MKPRVLTEDFDESSVLRDLSRRDPKMGKLIKRIGPFQLKMKEEGSPYFWLIRSIIYQQLHGKAAATIHKRMRDLFDGRDPKPHELLAMDQERMLGAGLSRNKLAALRDLARAAGEGLVPTRRQAKLLTDEEIIERLIPIRGVGRWTVEMLLIFGLKRADVLAVDDFALKKAAMLLYGLEAPPKKQAFLEIGEKWRPWRTIASWYLWRSLDS